MEVSTRSLIREARAPSASSIEALVERRFRERRVVGVQPFAERFCNFNYMGPPHKTDKIVRQELRI